MKKILIATVLSACGICLAGTGAMAQSSQGSNLMSVQEANRLNGTVMPTKDGKPYDQWVAEEKAKQKISANIVQEKSSNSGLVKLPASGNKVAPVENKTQKDEMGPKPVISNTVVKTEVKPEETKVATTVTAGGNFNSMPTTTAQQKPAESQVIKGTSADPTAKIETETVKVVAPAPDKAVTTEKPASRPADSVKDKKD